MENIVKNKPYIWYLFLLRSFSNIIIDNNIDNNVKFYCKTFFLCYYKHVDYAKLERDATKKHRKRKRNINT